MNFTEGVIRILRGDYSGAQSKLERVENSSASTNIRVQALLMRAASAELSGGNGRAYLDRAKELNPTLRAIFQFEVMTDLQHIARSSDEKERKELAASAKKLLVASQILFAPEDTWFAAASGAADNYLP